MAGPVSPEEYGEGMNDAELEADGRATGLDVWGPVMKAYSGFVADGALSNSQLWSLDQAIRADERRRLGVPTD